MPKLYTQEEVDKLLAEKLDSVRTKDLTDDEIAAVTGYRKSGATWPVVEEVARAVISADREKNK